MRCPGLHCEGCHQHDSGPTGPAALVAVLLVFVALGVHKAWPQVVQAAQIVGWTLAGVSGTVIAVTSGVLTRRAVRARRARRAAVLARPVVAITPHRRAGRPAPAIDPPAAARPRPLPGWRLELRPPTGGDRDGRRAR